MHGSVRQPVSAATGIDPALTALLDVAADYYWEQDASYRFTVWRPTRSEQGGAGAAGELLGKTSAELCAAPGGDPEHWVRHRALLEAREPFRDVMHVLAARGGPSQHLILSGAPTYAPNGEFVGYRGVARDSGGLIRMERLLDLEGKWVRGLAEADDLASVLPLILSLTCEFARFSHGCYWSVDPQRRALQRVASYGASSGARSVLVAGEAVPEWLEADPVWLADPGEADGAAWRSALVVPVAAGGSIIGVLEFRSSDTASPDAGFLHVLRGVTVQLGHLHARAAAAERLRESESRFASTMALAAIGISHVDDEGRFLYVNPQLCAMLGYSERELLALTVKEISHPDDMDTTHELVEPVAPRRDYVVQGREALHTQERQRRLGRPDRRPETRPRRPQALRRVDRRGHLGSQRGRGVHPLPRQPRSADGLAESRTLLAPLERRVRDRAPRPAQVRRAVRGSRSLQDHQRLARP